MLLQQFCHVLFFGQAGKVHMHNLLSVCKSNIFKFITTETGQERAYQTTILLTLQPVSTSVLQKSKHWQNLI